MASIDENLDTWSKFPWSKGGDEWSEPWGSSEALWWSTLYPRIQRFLPVDSLLEIAPGFGRWTHYLRRYCHRLHGVDLTPRCIDACRERFAGDDAVSFEVNDGRTLPSVPSESVDFVFSFDSLVHAELEVLADYLGEILRVLRPTGVAFLHHSNLGAFRDASGALTLDNPHWRSPSVTAPAVRNACSDVGLTCVSQEIVNWGGGELIDCFTVAAPAGSPHARETLVVENVRFDDEIRQARHVYELYHRDRG